MALELLPGLHDPYAGVAAKLARFSSAVSGPDVPPVDVPKVTTQVPDVTQVDTRKFRGGRAWRGVAASQGSGCGKRELWLRLCKPVGRSGWEPEAMPAGPLFCRHRDARVGRLLVAMVTPLVSPPVLLGGGGSVRVLLPFRGRLGVTEGLLLLQSEPSLPFNPLFYV